MKGLNLDELVAWNPPTQKWLMDQLIIPQGKVFLFGQAETWKSTLSIHLAFCLATGKPFFGFKTTFAPTYILQSENPQLMERERVLKYTLGNSVYSNFVWFCSEPYIKIDQGWGYDALEKELTRTKAKVLLIDPLYDMYSGRLTDEYDVRKFLDKMNVLCSNHGIAIIIVHHMRKPQMYEGVQLQQGIDDLFGSMFKNWCDTAIMLEQTGEDGKINVKFEKARNAEIKLKPFVIQIDRTNYQFKMVA
jgi:RecA-family ATPase